MEAHVSYWDPQGVQATRRVPSPAALRPRGNPHQSSFLHLSGFWDRNKSSCACRLQQRPSWKSKDTEGMDTRRRVV